MCLIEVKQYCVHFVRVYICRNDVDVSIAGKNLPADCFAVSRGTRAERITVEWSYVEVKMYWIITHFKQKLKICEGLLESRIFLKYYCITFAAVCFQIRSRSFFSAHIHLLLNNFATKTSKYCSTFIVTYVSCATFLESCQTFLL